MNFPNVARKVVARYQLTAFHPSASHGGRPIHIVNAMYDSEMLRSTVAIDEHVALRAVRARVFATSERTP